MAQCKCLRDSPRQQVIAILLTNEWMGYYMGWDPLYLTLILLMKSDFTARLRNL